MEVSVYPKKSNLFVVKGGKSSDGCNACSHTTEPWRILAKLLFMCFAPIRCFILFYYFSLIFFR